MKNFTREYIIENIETLTDNVITLSVASNAPYTRYDEKGNAYDEVLQISENAIDFSRLVDERCPFIYEHDTDKQLGVVEKAYIVDNKLYVDVRFSENEFPQNVLKDIISGIRRNTSIGYAINDYTMIRNPHQNPTMLVTKWMPYECSSVSCPADYTVGYSRSLQKETTTMNNEEDKKIEAKKCDDEEEIRSLGELTNNETLAAEFIANKRSLTEFKAELKSIKENKLNVKERKMEKYSLRKAILSNTTHGKFDVDSIENKVNEELKRKFNVADADIVMPSKRAIDGSEVLNQVDYRPDLYAGMLRPESTIARAGVTYVNVDGPSINFAVQTSGTVGGFVGTNNEIPSATATWEQKTLEPKKFGAYQEINYKALLQDRPEIENLIVNDILAGLDEIRDKALICGSGENNEPLGIYTLSTINTVTMPSAWTLSTALAFEKPIRDANINTNNLKWIMSSDKYYELASTPKSSTAVNEFLVEDGKMLGYECIIDNHLPASGIMLGDFSEALVADFEPISLKIVEDAQLSRKQAVEVQAFGAINVVVRRPKAFTKGA